MRALFDWVPASAGMTATTLTSTPTPLTIMPSPRRKSGPSPSCTIIFLAFLLFLVPRFGHAYPSQSKIWVLPFIEEQNGKPVKPSSSSYALASGYAEAAISSTQEGGQRLMTPAEVRLALALTVRTAEEAFLDEAWVKRIAIASDVRWILRGRITHQGSSITVDVSMTRPQDGFAGGNSYHGGGQQGTASGEERQWASICVKALRIPLYRLDIFWPWSADIPEAQNHPNLAGIITGLGHIGSKRYFQAIEELQPIAEGYPPDPDAEYWLIQSYAGAGLPEMVKRQAERFLQSHPNDPRKIKIQGILRALPNLQVREPRRDQS